MTDGEFICAFNFLASHRGPVFRIILREFSSVKKISVVNLLVYYVQWRTKILGTIIKTFIPALTYQVCKYSIISTFAVVQMLRIALPNSPPLHPRNDAGKV